MYVFQESLKMNFGNAVSDNVIVYLEFWQSICN